MTLICYLTAGAVNLFWLILGDRLSLPVQMAIPILTVVATLLLTVLVFAKKMLWNAYIGYAIAMVPLGFLPLLLYACKAATLLWTCAAPAVCTALSVLAMAIFSRKKFKSEVIRRFHF